MLELVEEALDQVALAVESEVGLARRLAVGLRGYDRRDPAVIERLDERVGVVALVGEEGLRVDLVEQRLRLRDVGGLSRCEREGDRVAERIDDDVDLRLVRPPRERPMAWSLPFFLGAGAVLMRTPMVASSIINSLSVSRANVSKTRANTPL